MPKRIAKRVCATVLLVSVLCLSSAFAAEDEANIQFKGDTMAASIKNTPLKVVLEKIKKDKGLWYKGDPALLDTPVSAKFDFLPTEEGLKRLLEHMSYAIAFDQHKKVTGVTIHARRGGPLPVTKEKPQDDINNNPDFQVIPGMAPPENPDAPPIDTTITENCAPPENPNAPTIDTTVVPNCPPPGAPETEQGSASGPKAVP